MARDNRRLRPVDATWRPSAAVEQWAAERFPAVDVAATAELFTDKALAGAWLYADWNAAFRNYIRNAERFGGVAYKSGLADPRWSELLKEGRALGFRPPHRAESPEAYRTALRQWRPPEQGNIVDFASLVRRMPGS